MEIEEAIYLFNKNKELIHSVSPDDVIESTQNPVLNGTITHTVRSIYTVAMEEAQFFGAVDVDDSNIFWMYKIDTKGSDNDVSTLKGTYVLFDDLKGRGGVMIDRRPQNVSVSRILPDILSGTGWQVGQVRTANIGTSNYYYVSKLEAFWDFLEKWRVEFRPRMTYSKGKITGKYIDIYDRLSDDYGKWYEYGDKLMTIVKEESSTNLFTAFIGRGKGEEVSSAEDNESGQAGYGRRITFEDVEWSSEAGDPVDKPLGQNYVEVPEATALYGYEDGSPRYTIVEFSDEEDKEQLLRSTYEHAVNESRPKAQFKSTVIEKGKAELGETVTIVKDQEDIRYKTRIFELTRDFKNKDIKSIDFGDKLVKTTAERSREASKAIRETEEQTLDWLEQLRKQIVNRYFNEDGYNYDLQAGNEYDLPGGYYSFDRPIDQDPTKVIYVGAGRLLIANSKTPDGHWAFRTAATGDGFVADEINTGTLNADLVRIVSEDANITLGQDGFTAGHNDGSFTQVGPEGIRRYTADDNRNYHYLIYTTSFVVGDSSDTARWIQLPDDFKGKQFSVYLAVADSLNAIDYSRSIQRIVATGHPGYSNDYQNAKVPIIGYKSETLMDGQDPAITDIQGMLIAVY